MAAIDPNAPAAAPRTRKARAVVALDALVLVAVAVLVVFPVLAWLAARAQPVAPEPAIRLPALPPGGGGERLRHLPAGLSPGAALPTSPREPLGGRITERRLERVSEETDFGPWEEGHEFEQLRRAYRDAGLERLLPARPTADLGARLLLLAAEGRVPDSAAVAAYEVLDRARSRGGCAPQLDLLVLVVAGASDGPADVEREAARARQACPRDPTPPWLLGQYQSRGSDTASALATFRALERSFPRSAAGWSGEADAYLRVALEQPRTAKFTARRYYGEAFARYRRAARLDLLRRARAARVDAGARDRSGADAALPRRGNGAVDSRREQPAHTRPVGSLAVLPREHETSGRLGTTRLSPTTSDQGRLPVCLMAASSRPARRHVAKVPVTSVLMVDAGTSGVELALLGGKLSCPSCGGELRPWGHARERVLRGLAGVLVLRPRGARCRACRGTHVLLPAVALLRRRDVVVVIGAALMAKAAGAGFRRIARALGVPAETVRGWLRRFAADAEAIRARFTRWAFALDPGLGRVSPAGSGFADAVEAIGLAVRAFVSRFGSPVGWPVAALLSGGGLLCHTSCPFPALP